jgi:hypothetical protein
MTVQKRINRLATNFISKNTLSRQVRGHADLLQFIFPDNTSSLSDPILNQRLRKEYVSTDLARYHRGSLIYRKLVVRRNGNYYLTPFGASVLCSADMRRLIRAKGFVELDLKMLFELLDAESEGKVEGLPIRELSSRLGLDRDRLYVAKSRLASGKTAYIQSRKTYLCGKASERLYAITDAGIQLCNRVICNFLANRIIREYKLPRWISISEMADERWKYPPNVQRFIEKSLKTLSQRKLIQESHLSRIEFFVFPWLEPVVIEYVISKYWERPIEYLRETSGFDIIPTYIFTGTDAIRSFAKGKGARATLFALESLHLAEAEYLRKNSILVGGVTGTTAYSIMGRGKEYKKAAYVESTVFSKRLVESVAKIYRVRDSSIIAVDEQGDYMKVTNLELEDNYIWHSKSPFAPLMKTQFTNVKELLRKPITVGLFISNGEDSELTTGLELRGFVRLALETIRNPRVYYEAVEHYVKRLPKLNRAFSDVPIVKMIDRSNRKKASFRGWREIFNGFDKRNSS